MENIKNQKRREIIINFYQKNQAKGKLYTVNFFSNLDVKRGQVYQAIARYQFGESRKQQKGTGRPNKLDWVEQEQHQHHIQ